MADRSIPRFPRTILGTNFNEFSQVLDAIGGIITSAMTVTVEKIVNGIETIQGALTINGTQHITGDLNIDGSLILGIGALDAIPHGAITAYTGPLGAVSAAWLLCDGAGYDPVDYPDLFPVIGYTYGGAGPIFNVPDLRGRIPIGPDNGAGLITTAPNTLGGYGGQERHQLTVPEIPAHQHIGDTDVSGAHPHPAFIATGMAAGDGIHQHGAFAITGGGGHLHQVISDTYPVITSAAGTETSSTAVVTLFSGPAVAVSHSPGNTWSGSGIGGTHQHDIDFSGTTAVDGVHVHPITLDPTGSNTPHNNLMPYIVVNYIIKK